MAPCSCVLAAGVVLSLVVSCKTEKTQSTDEERQRVAPPPASVQALPDAGGRPWPTSPEGTADLTITGAIERRIEGPVVKCGYTRLHGLERGATWAVVNDDFAFQIVVLTDDDFDEPTAVLTTWKPELARYVSQRDSGLITAAADRTVAEIDAELRAVQGKASVHVKGTMNCAKK